MSLESLLKPFKAIDDELISYYTRLGKNLGIEGNKKYKVGMGLDITATFFDAVAISYSIYFRDESLTIFNSAIFHPFSMDFAHNVIGLSQDEKVADEIVLNPIEVLLKKRNSILKLPVLTAGACLILWAIGDYISYSTTASKTEHASAVHFLTGLSWLVVASSMYLKEIDDKFLKRKPFFKKMYEGAKEKLSSRNYAPGPATGIASEYFFRTE